MRNSKQLLEKEEFLIRENENHCILGYSGIPTYIFRDDEVRKVIADFCSQILFEEWDNIGEELIEIYTFEEVSEEDEAKYGVGDETPYENPVPTKEGMKKFLIAPLANTQVLQVIRTIFMWINSALTLPRIPSLFTIREKITQTEQ